MKYSIEKISWIDCIFAPMNDVHSISIRIMCKAWSNNETLKQGWIAHCLEHMFFKWWKRYKTQKDVAETLDWIWAAYNAFTSNNTVDYFVKCAPNFVEQSLDVLADMMMNAKFDEKELEKEKWVIIQEMKMYEDDPMSLVSEKQRLWYFGNNSFGRPVIWNEKTVSSFTSQDLHDYKNSLYTKDNLIIVVAGKWAEDEKLKKLIWNYFWSMGEKRTVKKPKFPWKLPKEHESFFKKWTEQNHLIIAAPWFDGNDERRYAAKVLASILGWNMSSRLFQNIRTKEWLCYYISAYHVAGPETWTFGIRAWMDKSRFEFWLKRIREEVEKYVKNWATQDEFDKCIWYLQWQTQMGIDTPEEMALFFWSQYLVYNKIETLDEILDKYKKLTLNDVNQLSNMLTLDNCYTYHIE
jgi:predicted Zn-dependent peptidase